MTKREGRLVLVRHGQSLDNELNLFSGWRDPELTARGIAEARAAGLKLKEQGFRFDAAFTSKLNRARHSLKHMLDEMGETSLPVFEAEALNERDYGELSGLNKEGAVAIWGREQVHLWRKSYRAVPPGGESLAMTAIRTVPFCAQEIVPRIEAGQNILVVAHGNSLRSIVKHLDRLSDDDVPSVHIATSEVLIYTMAAGGVITGKTSFLAPSASAS
ncbi:MAG: 2,3-bisphosphoglycerate-dependent phosphoglycerate mutase [Beijerinckiaceae bacterium]|jgi:2,3-bisphosphoglycerate-dependent phosphoglycerate mutase